MALRILDMSEIDYIRSTCMSMLTADRARNLVPDSMLTSFQFIGRAEQLVIRRFITNGAWQLIAAGNAPSSYAGGDPISAQQLIKSAVIMYTCSFLCPALRQLIPKSELGELVTVTRDIDWTALQKEYRDQANIDMSLLLSVSPPSALRMAKPIPQPSDPDSSDNIQFVRPTYWRPWSS